MKLIFIRHGEAIDNVKRVLSDKEIYWSVLTETGIKAIEKVAENLPKDLNKLYFSPLPRTTQTAHIIFEKFPNVEAKIDNRIREINYGKFSGKENNKELDKVRLAQAEGDYFIRFGEFGENRFEIEMRLSLFFKDLLQNSSENDTIAIVSHGSVISFMKRILNVKTKHLEMGTMKIVESISPELIDKHIEMLNDLKE